jgi:NhaP-type Na+/H+ or K+/H+ antiporter
MVQRLSDWALVTILFSDALRLGWPELRRTWRLPGRALFLGLPLTVLGIAMVGRWLLRLEWNEALLLGAILSPTDPVFASAIVGREEIPVRLRHLLNVESGLNDGLALPLVIVLMAVTAGAPLHTGALFREAAGGVALGAAVGFAAGRLRALRIFGVAEAVAPLHGVSTLLITYSAAQATGLNSYLAAFAAGVAFASACPTAADDYRGLGEQAAELLKLAAVFIFAVMLAGVEVELPWVDYLFGAIVLTFVRFIAIEIALSGSGLPRAERLTAAWFGPKGFASVVYGLLLLGSTVPRRHMLFQVVALVIVMSIVLHSSTDVPVAKYFSRSSEQHDDAPAGS